jgi:hypothetical protein
LPLQSAYTNDDHSKDVVYRRPKVNGHRRDDVGRPLKAALEKFCRHAAPNAVRNANANANAADDSGAALDYYIGEVFRQVQIISVSSFWTQNVRDTYLSHVEYWPTFNQKLWTKDYLTTLHKSLGVKGTFKPPKIPFWT